jgi:hypothetical protein
VVHALQAFISHLKQTPCWIRPGSSAVLHLLLLGGGLGVSEASSQVVSALRSDLTDVVGSLRLFDDRETHLFNWIMGLHWVSSQLGIS